MFKVLGIFYFYFLASFFFTFFFFFFYINDIFHTNLISAEMTYFK
jgi:hypothetical protein